MHGERWRQKPSEIGGREGVGQLVQAKNWGISHAHTYLMKMSSTPQCDKEGSMFHFVTFVNFCPGRFNCESEEILWISAVCR